MRLLALLVLCAAAAIEAADPGITMYWTAAQAGAIDRQIAGNVDPQAHLGLARLMDSVLVIHRDGPSQVEIHTQQADFIVVRAGQGAVLVGGTAPGARPSAPGEKRGRSIQGATRYSLKAGDQIYVPANTPHQFLVDAGNTLTATIVKITPKK